MASGRYRLGLQRVLNTYAPGTPSFFVALNALLDTVIEQTQSQHLDEIAQRTCTGLYHLDSPPKGVICRKCFDAVEAGKTAPDIEDAPAPPATKEEADANDAIAKQVRMLIGAPEESPDE